MLETETNPFVIILAKIIFKYNRRLIYTSKNYECLFKPFIIRLVIKQCFRRCNYIEITA